MLTANSRGGQAGPGRPRPAEIGFGRARPSKSGSPSLFTRRSAGHVPLEPNTLIFAQLCTPLHLRSTFHVMRQQMATLHVSWNYLHMVKSAQITTAACITMLLIHKIDNFSIFNQLITIATCTNMLLIQKIENFSIFNHSIGIQSSGFGLLE